jgi:hypothetical protein
VASATFLASILDVPAGPPRELSVPVKVSNGVTLDYVDAERFDPHHCAFLASEAEFDAAYARIRSTHWHEGWTRSSRCGEDTVLPVVADQLAPDRTAAWPVARRPEQGWSLLCNGVVLFDDGGQLLPDGRAISPASTCTAAAA